MATKRASSKSSKKASQATELPPSVASRISPALAAALADAAAAGEGKYAHGILYRDPNEKLPVRFHAAAAWDVLENAGESLPETAFVVPLSTLGKRDDEVFAVDPRDPAFPVLFFEHEAGYHRFAPSLDAFVAGLLKKGEKTPLEKLGKIYDAANARDDQKDHAAVVKLLEPALKDIPRRRTIGNSTLPSALNLLGLAYKNLGRIDEAVAAFEDAERLGEEMASLNLGNLFESQGDLPRALAKARLLAARGRRLSSQGWFLARKLIVRVALALGQVPLATRVCHEVRGELEHSEPQRYAALQGDLVAIEGKGGKAAATATALLAWMRADPARTAAQAAALRRHWEGLDPAVRDALQSAADVPADPTDVDLLAFAHVSALTLESRGITDLRFLQPLTDLGFLSLNGNPLPSLASLPRLPQLSSLYLNDCTALRSLVGLHNAPYLTQLNIDTCGLERLDGVEALRGLERLSAENNAITSLAPLSALKNLRKLSLDENAITDLSPLANCRALEDLHCRENPISAGVDVVDRLPTLRKVRGVKRTAAPPDRDTNDDDRAWWAALQAHPRLQAALRATLDSERDLDEQLAGLVQEDHLSLDEEDLSTLEPLSRLTSLRFLDVARNPLASLAGLHGPALRTLRAGHTAVASLEPLSTCTNLQELDVNATAITSLAPLGRCAALRDLECAETGVADLGPLRGLVDLEIVRVAATAVADLAPLSSLPALHTVDCAFTRVTDLAPLQACPQLERVDCYGLDGVRGALALAGLPHLRAVFSHGALPRDEVEALRRARPDVDVD